MRRSVALSLASIAILGGSMPAPASAPPIAINPELPAAARGNGPPARHRGGSTSNLLTKVQKKRRNKLAKQGRRNSR